MTDPSEAQRLLRACFDAAVQAASPQLQLAAHLPAPPNGRVIVIGAGKASAAMARALEQAWPDVPLQGLVVTRYGHAEPCARVEIVEASHPVPDAAGAQAAARMLEMVRGLSPDDLVICLISGGGSSLLPLALPGVSLADKQAVSKALLKSGASIQEMNTVRRHLSAIKGGRLAAACAPARLLNLVISDVPGDSAHDIASGPTVADPTTCADALAVLERYRIDVPATVAAALASAEAETLKPGDARLPETETVFIATPMMALRRAAEVAQAAGIQAHILGDAIEGEAREVAKVLAAMAQSVKRHGQPFQRPCLLLSGGETTVTVRGNGRGGRNVEFTLALALALRGEAGIHALAADTDGVDGEEEVAGAWIDPATLQRARELGLDAAQCLDANDAHRFFEVLQAQVITGPTRTNVNDFRAILID